MKFFKKEILTNPVRFQDTIVQFEPVGGGTGVTMLDESQHGPLIAELDRLADRQVMGIVRLSAEQYDGLKKNPLKSQQRQSLPAQIRTVEPVDLLKKPSAPSKGSLAAPVGEPLPKTSQVRTVHASPELAALLAEEGHPVPPPVEIPAKPPQLPKPKAKAKRGNRALVAPEGATASE